MVARLRRDRSGAQALPYDARKLAAGEGATHGGSSCPRADAASTPGPSRALTIEPIWSRSPSGRPCAAGAVTPPRWACSARSARAAAPATTWPSSSAAATGPSCAPSTDGRGCADGGALWGRANWRMISYDMTRQPGGRRGRTPLPEGERKDRLIQTASTRISTKRSAARPRRSAHVSQLIRNVLQDASTWVDDIVVGAPTLTETVRQDARRIAASAKGEERPKRRALRIWRGELARGRVRP